MTATATDKYCNRVTPASPRKLAFPQCPPEPASSSCTHCCCAAWPCRLTRHPSPSCTEQWDTACPALPDNGWPPKQGWCYNAHSLPMFFCESLRTWKGNHGNGLLGSEELKPASPLPKFRQIAVDVQLRLGPCCLEQRCFQPHGPQNSGNATKNIYEKQFGFTLTKCFFLRSY